MDKGESGFSFALRACNGLGLKGWPSFPRSWWGYMKYTVILYRQAVSLAMGAQEEPLSGCWCPRFFLRPWCPSKIIYPYLVSVWSWTRPSEPRWKSVFTTFPPIGDCSLFQAVRHQAKPSPILDLGG